uniref:Secreted protein n=1 Tax=Panagrellus redivivus TaxID=6233 RepID=A0A7E4V2M3_PANRE
MNMAVLAFSSFVRTPFWQRCATTLPPMLKTVSIKTPVELRYPTRLCTRTTIMYCIVTKCRRVHPNKSNRH